MIFRVELNKIQHIHQLSLELDLSKNKITGIVGRNGVGKSTLMKALKNLCQSDTFLRTSQSGIFSPDSTISYWADADYVTFEYDPNISSLNCKKQIPLDMRRLCDVELSIPYGERFNFFQSISRTDLDTRRKIILEEYDQPTELIQFLSTIYTSDKYRSLIETKVGENSYFCILLSDGRYVREDYLSSGEYFLINLYRSIKGSARLIIVDEIDISLDAAAQVHPLNMLREFCKTYFCNVVFTTHSLAMMRTLKEDELYYMERLGAKTTIKEAPYSYIKSLLYGFTGWDRYILTEDKVLNEFLETLIRLYCQDVFFKYKIIYIGGGAQVVDLLKRNRNDALLSDPANVIAVLDGDQNKAGLRETNDIYFLPFKNVEAALSEYYVEEGFPYKLPEGKMFNGPKDLLNSLQRDRVISSEGINKYIICRNRLGLEPLLIVLGEFLSMESISKKSV